MKSLRFIYFPPNTAGECEDHINNSAYFIKLRWLTIHSHCFIMPEHLVSRDGGNILSRWKTCWRFKWIEFFDLSGYFASLPRLKKWTSHGELRFWIWLGILHPHPIHIEKVKFSCELLDLTWYSTPPPRLVKVNFSWRIWVITVASWPWTWGASLILQNDWQCLETRSCLCRKYIVRKVSCWEALLSCLETADKRFYNWFLIRTPGILNV